MRRWFTLVALVGVALAAAPAAAQEQKVASVGVAPIAENDPTPRDSALRAAVRTAVAEAAAAMLPASFTPPTPPAGEAEREPNAWLSQKLGNDPFVYVTRFRVVEDRGRRPAMFSADRSAQFEYVVLAEVTLDLDAIRAKMEKLGLAERGTRGPAREVTLVVEGLTSYVPLAMVRKTLERDRGVRSVRAVEFTTGRAVLAVDADEDAAGLAAGLARRAPEGLAVTMVEQAPARATVRVDWQPPVPAAPPAPPPTVGKPAGD
jgi:hypothetical protein